MSRQTQSEMNAIAARNTTSPVPFDVSTRESRILRKLQIRLLPFPFLLYMFAFIERIDSIYTEATELNTVISVIPIMSAWATEGSGLICHGEALELRKNEMKVES